MRALWDIAAGSYVEVQKRPGWIEKEKEKEKELRGEAKTAISTLRLWISTYKKLNQQFEQNSPGEGPIADCAVHLVLHDGVIAKSFDVKSLVCHRLLRGRLYIGSWYAVGCVQLVGVQSVGVKSVMCR